MACPYGVRYLNKDEKVVEKCTLCEQKIAQGELPQCVSQCGGRARYFGDAEKGIKSFEGPIDPFTLYGKDNSYAASRDGRVTLGDYIEPFDESTDVYQLPDVGNGPSFYYIMRNHKWYK